MATCKDLIKVLKNEGKLENVEGMARFGITAEHVLGVSMPFTRKLAGKTGRDHKLALELWDTGIYDARILAGLVDEPGKVTESQLERWVRDFDNWAICDGTCMNLFDKTPWAYAKCFEWSAKEKEFVKRAGYVMMAVLSVHDKKRPDGDFVKFFPSIKAGAGDPRNFVKKAVNWAVRQIGKRNKRLNAAAIKLSKEIQKQDFPSARWIAADALRELTNPKIQKRLK
jgi:3-methyladenine DNA glycosylase AlkD